MMQTLIGQRPGDGFGAQTELVLEVRQHLLKVPGVVGLAAARAALEVVGFHTAFAVEVPSPPLPKRHSPPLSSDFLNAKPIQSVTILGIGQFSMRMCA
jgi:hypothetical protein